MNVFLVTRWYPTATGFGGIATYNHCLAHALTELGHKVTVIAARWSPEVPAVEHDGGVTVQRLLVRHRWWLHRLPLVGRYMRFAVQVCYSIRLAWKIRGLAKRGTPDVVEFAEVEAEGFIHLLSKPRWPVVVRCHTPMFVLRRYHTYDEMPYDTRLTEMIETYCIRHADVLTAPSHDMARTIAHSCRLSERRIEIVPNGLHVQTYGPAARFEPVGDDPVIVLYVGRLQRAKGIEVLARAIPEAIRGDSNLRFVFIGNDPPDGEGITWRHRIESQLHREEIDGHLSFLGRLDEPTLLEWYRRAHIAVVPSLLYESFSYTCAQAMAAGIPVIASRIGGIPETLGDGCSGVLVEPGDSHGLAMALIRLAGDSALRQSMGQMARAKARAEFGPAQLAQNTLDAWSSARRRGVAAGQPLLQVGKS